MIKEIKQKIAKEWAKYFFTAYAATTITILPYCLGRMVYDSVTADVTTTLTKGRFCPSTFYGFDDDGDGTLDRIIEHSSIAGARMAAPTRRVYTQKDDNFESLKDLLK